MARFDLAVGGVLQPYAAVVSGHLHTKVPVGSLSQLYLIYTRPQYVGMDVRRQWLLQTASILNMQYQVDPDDPSRAPTTIKSNGHSTHLICIWAITVVLRTSDVSPTHRTMNPHLPAKPTIPRRMDHQAEVEAEAKTCY